jgi:phosphoribosylformylglycinamidine synthase subunit PurL
MGAAGLTSSSVEMAGRSGSGLDLDLDRVPRRARRLSPYEMLLSESQERMLLVAMPGKEARVLEICKKWELDAAIIGHVTDTGRWVIRATPGYDPLDRTPIPCAPQVVCDLPVDFLTEAAPKYDRPQKDDARLPLRLAFDPAQLAAPSSFSDTFLRLLGSPNLGSRRWVYRQYDHLVRGGTHARPGGDAAVIRVPCERGGERVDKILAFAADCNGRLCELDAYAGAAMAVAEACRNLTCAGAEPIGLTDCLNFGSPERPEIMRQFARAIDGMAAACKALDVPIVSGNVSLYNETDGRAILPTPTIGAVGLVRELGDVVRSTFSQSQLAVVLLGPERGGPLGGSEYIASLTGEVKGPPPPIDLALEARLQRLMLELCRARPRRIESAHDISDGGLAIALAECAVATDDPADMIGAAIVLPEVEPLAEALFGEAPSRILITARHDDLEDIERRAQASGVPMRVIGATGGRRLSILTKGAGSIVDVDLSAAREARERCLDPIVGA